MSSEHKLVFETLKADEVGRRLKTKSGRFEVAAKHALSDEGDHFLVVRLWIGSEPGPKATEGWSEPSTWSHTVYDLDHNMVAYGFGSRERDSWAMAEKLLGRKLSPIEAGAAVVDAPKSNKFVWQPGDVDFLTEEDAKSILGADHLRQAREDDAARETRVAIASDAEHFAEDDPGYLAWLAGHEAGYILNVHRDHTRHGLRLHRATCSTIQGTPTNGRHWTHEYNKVCSGSIAPLNAWVAVHVGGGAPEPCSRCNPDTEGA
jgi:hypothetical protein